MAGRTDEVIMLEVGSWKWEGGRWKLEVGSWKLEVGSGKWEVGSGKLEVKGLKFRVLPPFRACPDSSGGDWGVKFKINMLNR
jgi:hypothetical protein